MQFALITSCLASATARHTLFVVLSTLHKGVLTMGSPCEVLVVLALKLLTISGHMVVLLCIQTLRLMVP